MLLPLALRYIPSEPWEEMNTEENGTALAVFRARARARTRCRIFDYEYKHDGILWSRRPEPTFTGLMLDQSSLGYLPGAAEVAGTLLDAPGTIAAGRFASRRRRS